MSSERQMPTHENRVIGSAKTGWSEEAAEYAADEVTKPSASRDEASLHARERRRSERPQSRRPLVGGPVTGSNLQ
jgi:hypothetical protein